MHKDSADKITSPVFHSIEELRRTIKHYIKPGNNRGWMLTILREIEKAAKTHKEELEMDA
jgi:dynactin complex subunit